MHVSIRDAFPAAICFALTVLCFTSFATAQPQPKSPDDIVAKMIKSLQTCTYDEREDVFVEIDGNLGPDGKPLIPILMEMLRDTTPRSREPRIDPGGPRPKPTAQEIRDEDAESILGLISTFGCEGVEPLRRALSDKDASTRAYAARGLGKIGADAVDALPELTDALRDDDSRVRRNAVLALQQIGGPSERSVLMIAELLQDDDPQVVIQACRSLLQFGSAAEAALPQIVAASNRYERLHHSGKLPKKDKRHIASLLLAALVETEPVLAIPRLVRVLRSQEPYQTYGFERNVPADSRRKRDAQALAADRLASFGKGSAPAAPLLVELVREWETSGGIGGQSDYAFSVLVAIGKPARELIRLRLLPEIEKGLNSESVGTRLHAADRILQVFPRHQRALDEVVAALVYEGPLSTGGIGPTSDRRTKAAEIAARMGSHDRRIMLALKKLLDGPPTPSKLQAARAIGILDAKDTTWRDAMVECLHDYYKHRRGSEVTTWQSMGDSNPAIADAYKLLGDRARPFYAEYVGILPKFNGGDMFSTLTRDPKNMQRVVELGPAIVPTLIEAVEQKLPPDEWYNYNYMASEALGLIGKDASSAVQTLSKVLREAKDPLIRRDAAAALGRIGSNAETAVPALTSALDDPWASVRAASAKALLFFARDAETALPKLRRLEDSEFASVRKPAKAAIAAISAR